MRRVALGLLGVLNDAAWSLALAAIGALVGACFGIITTTGSDSIGEVLSGIADGKPWPLAVSIGATSCAAALVAVGLLIRHDRSLGGVVAQANRIACKTCDQGWLERRRVFGMSGIVVVIGWLLLIPSFLGMGLAGLGMVGLNVLEPGRSSEVELRHRLEVAGIPPALHEPILRARDVDLFPMTADQRRLISEVQASSAGRLAATGFLGASFICVFAGSLIAGLLGWLLIMKKQILQCTRCGAVTAAS